MTRARSAVALAAGALILLVVLVSPSGAQPQGLAWTSAWTTPADDPAIVVAPTAITGWFRYGPDDGSPGFPQIEDFTVKVAVADDTELWQGCPTGPIETTSPPSTAPSDTAPPTSAPPPDDPSRSAFGFDGATVTPVCNGTYKATVTATLYDGQTSKLSKTLSVAVPPPPVTSLSATADSNRSVTLRWSPPAGYADPYQPGSTSTSSTFPTVNDESSAENSSEAAQTGTGAPPDFLGYVVERSEGGDFSTIGTAPPGELVFNDAELPASGGTVRYRIRAVRPGATADSVAASSSSASVTRDVNVAGLPVTPTTARPGAGGGGGGGGGAATGPRTSSPTTVLVNPESELEPGEDDPVLPADAAELGGAIVNDVSDSGPGEALLVPVAIGLVMLVWAMHLRYLTRQAARVAS